MANKVMGYVICGYSSVDNLLSEQSSPFRRWTTGSGAGSSYRHHDHRNMYNKQISEGAVTSGASAGAAGGVARWSLGLEQLLADPAGAAAFAHFLSKEFAAENIRFWWSCEQYTNTEDARERATLAQQIWQRHLDEKASEPVNVDAAARRAAALRLCAEPAAPDLFQQAQKQIFNVMKFDSYPRFLRSAVHAECARADLRGLPPPYAHAPHTPHTEHTPTKLKKSASNASERRRSGGASLLPWKLRAPSRERAPPAPPPPPALTDVVKCSQWAGQCSLCRVVLPDGATSVVGVEATVSVRQLVDRLLQRRNLSCDTYDVVLRDADKGESSNIELTAASTTIGGKEVRVERRVVLRIEVGGRCVAVRCGRGRRLRHVLRPLLARYLPAPRLLAVLERGGCVRPDARVQDLEGVRLQVIELPDVKEYNSSGQLVPCVAVIRASQPYDTESEHNHRLDDAQSISVASGSSKSRDYSSTNGTTDTISLPTTNGSLAIDNCSLGDNNSIGSNSSTLDNGLGNSNSMHSNSGISGLGSTSNTNGVGNNNNNSYASNVGPNGRVRAALRSGPPLHHHPPDFLENLRETQRQRLTSNKTDAPSPAPAPSPPAPRAPPAARAPPPLPPKPPQRPPTLV